MSHFGFRLILKRAGKITYFGLKWGRENHDIFWSKKAGIMSHTSTEYSRTTGGFTPGSESNAVVSSTRHV